MTSRKATPWWQLPAVVGGVVIGLGAVGAGVVKLATFLTVPERVEAVEQKNVEQDKTLDALASIEAQNSQLLRLLSQDIPKDTTAEEVADDGEIKVLRINGKKLCCDGRTCWPWTPTRRCAR